MLVDEKIGANRSKCLHEVADETRERAAKLIALAIRLREHRLSIAARGIEQMAHELLARAEAIEGGKDAD